jgi:hypothetical protein
MAVLKTDFHDNPKILALGWDGMGLYAWGISYCDAQLTDGFVPASALPSVPRLKQAVAVLLHHERWTPARGYGGQDGYVIHDYLEHNRSRAQVEALRDADRTRKTKERRNGHA